MDLDGQLAMHERALAQAAKIEKALAARREAEATTNLQLDDFGDFATAWDAAILDVPPVLGVNIAAAPRIPANTDRRARSTALTTLDLSLHGYKAALRKSWRSLVRGRLSLLVARVDAILAELADLIGRPQDDALLQDWAALVGRPRRMVHSGQEPPTADLWDNLRDVVAEIDRLLGEYERPTHWSDFHRHLSFAQVVDFRDIFETDWPDAKQRIETALADTDIGIAGDPPPATPVAIELNWSRLTPGGFESLLHDLLQELPVYTNVTYLAKTNAPDKGRDLSALKKIDDGLGTERLERTIVQAKHSATGAASVSHRDISDLLASLELIDKPKIANLVIATTTAVTPDGETYIELHNADYKRPYVEVWGPHKLRRLLAERPHLIEQYGLR